MFPVKEPEIDAEAELIWAQRGGGGFDKLRPREESGFDGLDPSSSRVASHDSSWPSSKFHLGFCLLWARRIHGRRRIWGLSLRNRRSRHFRRSLRTRTSSSPSGPLQLFPGQPAGQDLGEQSPDSASYQNGQARELGESALRAKPVSRSKKRRPTTRRQSRQSPAKPVSSLLVPLSGLLADWGPVQPTGAEPGVLVSPHLAALGLLSDSRGASLPLGTSISEGRASASYSGLPVYASTSYFLLVMELLTNSLSGLRRDLTALFW